MSWSFNKNTSEWVSQNIKNPNWGNWIYDVNSLNEANQVAGPRTEESMIKEILERTDDVGFFNDMVEWIRSDAPRKIKNALRELCPPMHTGPISYERMCEVLYQLGFRASEILERRMTLAPSNKWSQRYFDDFPPKKNP